MVGFGSSLRMARRPGWETAYFDYETLKLLLSQIEAVYEEEWHRQRGDNDVLVGDEPGSPRSRKVQRNNKGGATDYRDELFLESNSDKAFASSASDLYEEHESLLSTDEEADAGNDPSNPGPSKPFTFTYSHEASSSDADNDSPDMDTSCGAASLSLAWRRGDNLTAVGSPTKKVKKKHKRRIHNKPPREDSEFYVGAAPDGFLLANEEEGDDHVAPVTSQPAAGYPSISGDPEQNLVHPNEQSGLLAQSSQSGTFFSFHTRNPSITPPRDFSGGWSLPNVSLGATDSFKQPPPPAPPNKSRLFPTAAQVRQEKLSAERRRKRRQRRRRRLLKKRQELERRVPRHLRIAHAKARSITERFLGLLRAEVEKVTLFAQSRLGELADTAGSLRFPSYEDSEYGSFSSHGRSRPRAYEHPLSDGGLHPSSSSSEDERPGARRSIFPWSDSSDEDENSEPGNIGALSPQYRPKLEKSFSSATASTLPRTNRSETEKAEKRDGILKSSRDAKRRTARDSVERKIKYFAELRRARPTFQRKDDIVGEDLLLLSAVDEADGYVAVGVELMHVLRYICVNVIAVRKICRKHDRLLTNRMLGGYYHRKHPKSKRVLKKVIKSESNTQQPVTLGSIVSRSVGEDCRVDPASVTVMNQNKLVGVYDIEVQELANSTTVQVISSCLALALSEYEVSRSRADALSSLKSVSANVKSQLGKDTFGPTNAPTLGLSSPGWFARLSQKGEFSESRYESLDVGAAASDDEGGPPSTASSVSLSRLRFTVVSIFALREAAREKLRVYDSFLSRSLLSFFGPNVVGDGLDGCSRAALDFLVAYEPDSPLLMDSSDIYVGLQEGSWRHDPIGGVMLSTLNAGVAPVSAESPESQNLVLSALSIMPVSSRGQGTSRLKVNNQVASFLSHSGSEFDANLDRGKLEVNRFSLLLQMMNYFIIHPTVNTFVTSVGTHPAHSATIIGATSFGGFIAASFHSHQLSRELDEKTLSTKLYPECVLLAALISLVGNVVYIIAISRGSVPLAATGRLLVGCGSADLFFRQMVSRLPAPCVVSESAYLINTGVFGVSFGLLTGAILASFSLRVAPFGNHLFNIGELQSGSYLMIVLWLFQSVRIVVVFFRRRGRGESSANKSGQTEKSRTQHSAQESQFSSDESDVDASIPGSLPRTSSGNSGQDDGKARFSAEDARIPLSYSPPASVVEKKSLKSLSVRLRKLIFYNVALPVTLALVLLVKLSHELLFTSCIIITRRYFGWDGIHAGLFLGFISAFAFVINKVCSAIADTYDERTVIKRSILMVGIGLFVMINYASLFTLASEVPSLLDETTISHQNYYDWVLGCYQYILGFALVFAGVTALEGTSLALMSKVAPTKLQTASMNCSAIVTLVGYAARVLGDVQISMVGLSHRLINTDIVNALTIPLLLAFVAAAYIVKKHFFFLI